MDWYSLDFDTWCEEDFDVWCGDSEYEPTDEYFGIAADMFVANGNNGDTYVSGQLAGETDQC